MEQIQMQKPQQQQQQQDMYEEEAFSDPTLIGTTSALKQQDVVTFVHAGQDVSVQKTNVVPSNLLMSALIPSGHGIPEILSRPKRVATIDFNDTFNWLMFFKLWMTGLVYEYLKPHMAISGTLCVKAVVNSNPFQTGMAMLVAVPSSTRIKTADAFNSSTLGATLGCTGKQAVPHFSGCPNVVINLATTSEAELRVPYIGPQSMNLLDDLIDTTFVFHNMVNLRGQTSAEKAEVNIYMWMEDVKLIGSSHRDPTVTSYIGLTTGFESKLTRFEVLQVKTGKTIEVDTPEDVYYEGTTGRGIPTYRAMDSEDRVLMETWLKDHEGFTRGVAGKPVTETRVDYGGDSPMKEQGTFGVSKDKASGYRVFYIGKDEKQLDAALKITDGIKYWAVRPGNRQENATFFEWWDKNFLKRKMITPQGIKNTQVPKIGAKKVVNVKGKTSQKESKEIGEEGWKISNVADSISKVASYFTAVPALADIAGPVSWIANEAAGVARFFGYSKPVDASAPQMISNRPLKHFAHGSGVSMCNKLTVQPDAETQVSPIGSEEIDEMTLAYVTSRPNFYFNMTWKKSNVAGDCLFQDVVNPAAFHIQRKFNIAKAKLAQMVHFNTHMSYVAKMFQFWRGSILFTITLAANKFYSGRLRVVFVPRMTKPTGVNDTWDVAKLKAVFDEDNKNYSTVIDIRDGDTFTIEVPYEAASPWLPTDTTYESGGPAIFVFVERPLVTTGTVADTIEAWTSVAAGDGFALAGPRVWGNTRLLPLEDGILVDAGRGMIKPQGLTLPPTSDRKPNVIPMAAPQPKEANLVAMATCIGDPVYSLRTLVSRPSEASQIPFDANNNSYVMIRPWLNTTVTGEQTDSVSYFQMARSLYRFVNGGVRVHIAGLNSSIRVKMIDVHDRKLMDLKTTYKADNGISVYSGAGPNIMEFSSFACACETRAVEVIEGICEYELPYYHTLDKIDNMLIRDRANGTKPYVGSHFAPNIALMLFIPKGSPPISVYMSAADDFNCGWLNGAPITFGRL